VTELARPSRVLAIGRCSPAIDGVPTAEFEVMLAPGKLASVELARELAPAAIVVGATDAGLSAHELVRQLARELERIGIVLLDETSTGDRLIDGLEAGASAVIERADVAGALSARLRSMVRAHRRIDSLLDVTRQETLLQLAGAVAHRMNQPLTSMMVIVETLGAALSRGELPPDRLRARLRELQRLVERMSVIVKQVGNIDEYRITDYIGDVKIIDIDERREP